MKKILILAILFLKNTNYTFFKNLSNKMINFTKNAKNRTYKIFNNTERNSRLRSTFFYPSGAFIGSFIGGHIGDHGKNYEEKKLKVQKIHDLKNKIKSQILNVFL